MTHQVCIFEENKPGRLARITKILKDENINVKAINIAISQGFGIVKLIVDNPQKTIEVLQGKGLTVYTRGVIAVLLDDQPGGLHRIARAFAGKEINIEDAYGFAIQGTRKGIIVLDVEEMPEAIKIISETGFRILDDEELHNL